MQCLCRPAHQNCCRQISQGELRHQLTCRAARVAATPALAAAAAAAAAPVTRPAAADCPAPPAASWLCASCLRRQDVSHYDDTAHWSHSESGFAFSGSRAGSAHHACAHPRHLEATSRSSSSSAALRLAAAMCCYQVSRPSAYFAACMPLAAAVWTSPSPASASAGRLKVQCT